MRSLYIGTIYTYTRNKSHHASVLDHKSIHGFVGESFKKLNDQRGVSRIKIKN